MKLNLIWDIDNANIYGEDFINLCPFLNQEQHNIKRGNIMNLDNVVDNGEAETIIATNIIDYLELKVVVPTIQHWVSKIQHGGKIIISGTDMYEICRNFTRYNITLVQTNEILHGKYSDKPYLVKKTQFTLKGLCELLIDCGLKIEKKNLDTNTMTFTVEAVRP